MPDLGVKLTDRRMKNLDKRLQGIYRAAYEKAIESEKAAIGKLARLEERLKEMGVYEDYEKMMPVFGQKVMRETNIVNNIAAEIARSGETAAKIIQGEMLDVCDINLDWSRFSVDKAAGVFIDWTIYDKNQLKVLLQEGQPPFTKIAYKNLGKNKKIVQDLQNQLTQAVMLGESQQQITRRIRDVSDMSYKRAKRIAQTERNRVQSQARFMGMQEAENIGVEMSKQWLSRMDSKVRDDHASVTGEIVDNDKPFSNGLMFPGDPNGEPGQVINCRCVLAPKVKRVPESVKRYREKMQRDYGFDEWRERRA